MTKKRLILYAVLGLFHLFLVIFTFYIDAQQGDFNVLLDVLKWITLMKYGAIFGLLLVIIDVSWSWITNRESNKEKAALTHELNTLKAKLFDMQEDAHKAAQQQVPPKK
jgi:hypothetical protein